MTTSWLAALCMLCVVAYTRLSLYHSRADTWVSKSWYESLCVITARNVIATRSIELSCFTIVSIIVVISVKLTIRGAGYCLNIFRDWFLWSNQRWLKIKILNCFNAILYTRDHYIFISWWLDSMIDTAFLIDLNDSNYPILDNYK